MDETNEGPLVVDPEWQVWAAENLIEGASSSEVVEALTEEGVPLATAQRLVDEVVASPILALGRSLLPRAQGAEQILRMERERLRNFAISRISTPSAERFHRSIRPAHRPIVFEGFLAKSPAVERWTFDWFAERFAGQPITYVDTSSGKGKSVDGTMDAFIRRIQEAEDAHHYYSVARNFVLRQEPFGELYDDFLLPEGFVSEAHHRRASQMWLGPAGTITPLHFDTSDVVFSMVRGSKRVQLVPPCELGVWGLHDGHMLSEARFAEFVEGGGLVFEVEVRAPDALFLPVGWLHRVVALEPSITMSINGFKDNNVAWYTPGVIRLDAEVSG
ncbi:MAG: hypothetical protein ACI9KE_003070 [Polyangiales bacterium]